MKKIITRDLKNIKRHLTGEEKIITLSLLVITSIFGLLVSTPSYAENISASANIQPSMTFTIPVSTISMNLNPASKPFESQTIPITVGTNNSYGYKVYVNTIDNNKDLINTTDTAKTIPTLASSGAYDVTTFPANHWGYRINSNVFMPFSSGIVVASSTGPVNEETTNMTLAAKIDYLQDSGTYGTKLNFSLIPDISVNYMQDLDPSICTTEPTMVTDFRDGQAYAIARLKDGKCWMVQNLRIGAKNIDGTNTITLNSSDSNVSSSYILSNKRAKMPREEVVDDVENTTKWVYDGDAFYCTPDSTNNYVTCYYNWYTATAGSGTKSTTGKDAGSNGVDVHESICPKGWILPKGGDNPSVNDFSILFSKYPSSSQMQVANPLTTYDNINGQYLPGFLLSGLTDANGVAHTTRLGDYWTRTAYSTGKAYGIWQNSTSVGPEGKHDKYYGFSIRCILSE